MSRVFRTLVTCLVAATAPGCHEEAGDVHRVADIEQFGLVSAPEDYALVGKSIDTANLVLAAIPGSGLVPGWKQGKRSAGAAVVLVFAVRSEGLGRNELMSTHRACGCVVLNASALSDWKRAVFGSSDALLAAEAQYLLGYILLHEVGHIRGDGGVADVHETPDRAGTSINVDPTTQKAREIVADSFAARAIRTALNQKGADAGLDAARISVELAKLSWNLSAHRLLDDFGGTVLKKHSLFWDAGLSHPNLEWRILSVNDMIVQSATSRQLLEEFEDARHGGK